METGGGRGRWREVGGVAREARGRRGTREKRKVESESHLTPVTTSNVVGEQLLFQ